MQFTAIINPSKRRDVATTQPKVLLTNIANDGEIFRDHCYIEINKAVEDRLNCMRTNRNFKVLIDGDIKGYIKRGEITQQTIVVNSIKVIGKA